MNRNKMLGLLSLSRKAGKLKVGFEPAVEAALAGEAALILLSSDLSEKSEKRLGVKLRFLEDGPPVLRLPFTMEELSHITKRLTGICTVTDVGFSGGLRALMTDDEEDTI